MADADPRTAGTKPAYVDVSQRTHGAQARLERILTDITPHLAIADTWPDNRDRYHQPDEITLTLDVAAAHDIADALEAHLARDIYPRGRR